MDIAHRIAKALAIQDYKAQLRQRAYFKPLPPPRPRVLKLEDLMPNAIWVANPDESRLLRVYYEIGENRAFFHLVFSDEYVPFGPIDDVYRTIRKELYGRTADVESFEVMKSGSTLLANFVSTYTGPNVYETSVHFDGREPYNNVLYVNTWNHLMSALPAPQIYVRYGYKEAGEVEFVPGTRSDAEEFAKEVSQE